MSRIILAAGWVLALAFSAAASPQPIYTCEVPAAHPTLNGEPYYGGGMVFYGGEFVSFSGYPEENEKLTRTPSASGEMYSDGKLTFESKGDEGFLTINADGTRFPCKPTRAMATGQSTLGSKVRSGPSLDDDVVDNLPQGEFVEFTGETGAFLDGFQWVKVRYGEGEEGFVWGGTVCSKEREITGVHFGCSQ